MYISQDTTKLFKARSETTTENKNSEECHAGKKTKASLISNPVAKPPTKITKSIHNSDFQIHVCHLQNISLFLFKEQRPTSDSILPQTTET